MDIDGCLCDFYSATVGNLQSKVEGLTTTNALMKEDLAIARNSLMALQAENLALRRSAQSGSNASANNNPNVHDHIDAEMAQVLSVEKKKRHDIERELELQVNTSNSLGLFVGWILSYKTYCRYH